jgi:glycosyltransferase involved in cell wall biosynthesis
MKGKQMNNTMQAAHILADGRWRGQHGIGRFATEVLARLTNTDILAQGPAPLSLQNLWWQSYVLARQQPYKVFFNPGFNPVGFSSIPFVFTIHDLIPLQVKNTDISKKLFFNCLIKPAAKRAHKVITVSEYSRQAILAWTHLPPEQVVVVGCGSSESFTPHGLRHEPGFPYLLHVGNNSKPHKNMARLLQAFARATKNSNIKLLCTGSLSPVVTALMLKLDIVDRVEVHPHLSESRLAAYYRGATGIVFPSLYEGFGLPVLEGMASGVPVLTSSVTSLPEVAGDAAILVDPDEIESIAHGIICLINDTNLRVQLIAQGLERAKLFSWDKTAQKVQQICDELI